VILTVIKKISNIIGKSQNVISVNEIFFNKKIKSISEHKKLFGTMKTMKSKDEVRKK